MNVGILGPTPNSVLQDARLLNSDIGRHSVQCNFSTRLAGRFYHNGSLERHTLRKSRLVEMQEKKRRLEQELQLEERRVKLLEERLNDTERAREDAHGLIITIERGVIRFQAFVRRTQALRLFRKLQHESAMRSLVAKFFQCRYRGWKGRERAVSRREYLREKQMKESAATIQANERRRAQRKHYLNLLMERNNLNNQSAATIQAMLRGNVTRQMFLAEMVRRQDAATNTQRMWRGMWARHEAERTKQEVIRIRTEAEKPKRIPLHLRKYSTYGANVNRRPKKRDARMRRRSSDAMIIMKDGQLSSLANLRRSSSSVGDPDENDSVASSAVTSLTGSGERRTHRIRNNPSTRLPSSPHPPPRLSGIDRRHTTLQPGRRSSLERRQTISGGSSFPPPFLSQRPSRERQPTLETFDDSDESSKEETPRERQKINDIVRQSQSKTDKPTSATRQSSTEGQKSQVSSAPARETIKTPITLSEEASFIVQEVLGKSVMRHSIMHSGFDDEFSEHEDDLE